MGRATDELFRTLDGFVGRVKPKPMDRLLIDEEERRLCRGTASCWRAWSRSTAPVTTRPTPSSRRTPPRPTPCSLSPARRRGGPRCDLPRLPRVACEPPLATGDHQPDLRRKPRRRERRPDRGPVLSRDQGNGQELAPLTPRLHPTGLWELIRPRRGRPLPRPPDDPAPTSLPRPAGRTLQYRPPPHHSPNSGPPSARRHPVRDGPRPVVAPDPLNE